MSSPAKPRAREYSMQAAAAAQNKFMRPVHAPNTPLNKITYALHSMRRCSRRI